MMAKAIVEKDHRKQMLRLRRKVAVGHLKVAGMFRFVFIFYFVW